MEAYWIDRRTQAMCIWSWESPGDIKESALFHALRVSVRRCGTPFHDRKREVFSNKSRVLSRSPPSRLSRTRTRTTPGSTWEKGFPYLGLSSGTNKFRVAMKSIRDNWFPCNEHRAFLGATGHWRETRTSSCYQRSVLLLLGNGNRAANLLFPRILWKRSIRFSTGFLWVGDFSVFFRCVEVRMVEEDENSEQ